MDPMVAILIVVALIVGLGLGWLLGGKPVGDARKERDEAQVQLKTLQEQFNAAIRDLAGASERAKLADDLALKLDDARQQGAALQGQLAAASERARQADDLAQRLDTVRAQYEAVATELSAMKADAANHEKQVRLLVEAREQLAQQFGEVGNKLLGEAQEAFLRRANERFAQSEEKNEEKIRALLAPVGERLKSYEDQVQKIEATRSEAYGNLTGLIEQMRAGQERVQTEAARLVNSLRNAPKARGRWGEQQLRNVLESCGLAERTDFLMELSVDTEDGRLRPDAVVKVPGGRSLVIDAKVSLNAYQDAFGADDDDARRIALTAHCASMKAHIDGLSRKAYWDQFADAPDYVIMFVPGEHFLSAALEHDAKLWDYAFEKKVLLATPTNLVAIARTVASVWRQEGLAQEARQIGQLGKELYDRLAVSAEHLKRVGSGLSSAVGHYNKFVGSFERNVLSTGRKFAALNIETGKRELEAIDEIEALPRYGDTALIAEDEAGEAAE
ncbi:DNA recombination protein RmuC [Blastomonas natatoria]|uniref:DNA recombination protein RmuC homolog n=1 Tax=Blastomonas natatoria TaxID=34015 RepID=A0A2V3V9G5_9SPHN|nr:DNA recombination protein RmuC [Blastomonas natatoria]PXW78423.1 DNA recombination protein RmuC [Blastomonas natatoria]